MSPRQEASIWLPDWISSNMTTTSNNGVQHNNENLDSDGDTTPAPQIVFSPSGSKDASTQTQNAGPNRLDSNTNLQPGHREHSPSVSSQTISSNSGETPGLRKMPPKLIIITPSPDRTVKRSLKGIHIFVSYGCKSRPSVHPSSLGSWLGGGDFDGRICQIMPWIKLTCRK